jgi:hypothetical protein
MTKVTERCLALLNQLALHLEIEQEVKCLDTWMDMMAEEGIGLSVPGSTVETNADFEAVLERWVDLMDQLYPDLAIRSKN